MNPLALVQANILVSPSKTRSHPMTIFWGDGEVSSFWAFYFRYHPDMSKFPEIIVSDPSKHVFAFKLFWVMSRGQKKIMILKKILREVAPPPKQIIIQFTPDKKSVAHSFSHRLRRLLLLLTPTSPTFPGPNPREDFFWKIDREWKLRVLSDFWPGSWIWYKATWGGCVMLVTDNWQAFQWFPWHRAEHLSYGQSHTALNRHIFEPEMFFFHHSSEQHVRNGQWCHVEKTKLKKRTSVISDVFTNWRFFLTKKM